jgi:hypothetical protein
MSAATKGNAGMPRLRGIADALAYAASPTFALLALVAASDASRMALCSASGGMPPFDGMMTMYLLMSLFHLPPWLRLISKAGRSPNR